jgi:hypothetical protein
MIGSPVFRFKLRRLDAFFSRDVDDFTALELQRDRTPKP